MSNETLPPNYALSPEEGFPLPNRHFVPGEDRQEIDREIQDLEADALIDYWSTFESTPDLPFPGARGRGAVDDIAAVLSGSKPAALFTTDVEPPSPLLQELFDKVHERHDIIIKPAHGAGNRWILAIGIPNSVDTIVEQYEAARIAPATDEFDKTVGRALGYSEAAIDAFLNHQNKVRTSV